MSYLLIIQIHFSKKKKSFRYILQIYYINYKHYFTEKYFYFVRYKSFMIYFLFLTSSIQHDWMNKTLNPKFSNDE